MKKYYILLIVVTGLFFSSCDHTTNCKIPLPNFDSVSKSVQTSTAVQTISTKKYDPLAVYTWYLLSTPTLVKSSIVSQASTPDLSYTFNLEGKYTFSLVSNKYDCTSDSMILVINSAKTNTGGGGGGNGPCTGLTNGKFKLQTTNYTASNSPSLSGNSTTYLYTGLYDNSSNTVYFYFPKTFANSPNFTDYTINGTKSYSSLSGTECAIEIKGSRYSAQNANAVVHITHGTTKTFLLSVCNFQYKYNNILYTLEAQFEFN